MKRPDRDNLDFTKYKLTRKQAIRWFCTECVGGDLREARNCTDLHCSLHPYRMGLETKVKTIKTSNLAVLALKKSKELKKNAK